MAAIVYEGAGGTGGKLFENLTFHFLQRVPSRQDFIQAVKSNGGQITHFDKKADIIIGDHARKDNPTGSISWTFIDRSVKAGKLEMIEDHRAGPPTHVVREVGSRQPAKSGRTPFTPQDDRELMLWVIKAERTGLPIKGNDIYIQLEEKNPRHTFQSWRDRWIKHLAHRPRPEIPEDEISAQGGDPVGSKYSNHQPTARRHHSISLEGELNTGPAIKQETKPQPRRSTPPAVLPKSPRVSTSKSAGKTPKDKPVNGKTKPILPLVRKSTGGMNFNEWENNYMIENFAIMAEADGDRGVEAWAKFSIDYPNHSAQEWHNHFIQNIKPMMERGMQKSETPKSLSKEIRSSAIKASPSQPPKDRSLPEGEHEVLDPNPIESRNVRKKFTDPSTKDERMFVDDLTAMAEDNEIDVNFNPIICGRKISLFRLWQVVNMDKFGGYEEVNGRNFWPQIARELNFTDFRHADAPRATKLAYEVVLPDFEVQREEYLAQLQEEDDMIASQLRQTAEYGRMREEAAELVEEEAEAMEEEEDEEDEYDDDLEAPTSAPRHSSSVKRNLEVDYRTNRKGSPILGASSKRQRFRNGKGKEPEVPESPQLRIKSYPKSRSSYQTSPLKYMQTGVEEEDEEELFVGPVKKVNLRSQQQNKRIVEPETQDFHFSNVNNDEESKSSPFSRSNRQKSKETSSSGPGGYHDDFSTPSQTDSQKNEELKAFIEHHQSIGYELEIVLAAIESTSMMTGNASLVMEELAQGREIPKNIQGVWTKADDAALDKVESKDFERIVEKHGTKSVVHRQKFLLLRSLEEEREANR